MITRRVCNSLLGAIAVVSLTFGLPSAGIAEGKVHKMLIHVSDGDKAKMNMALNIVQAISKQYKNLGDSVVIEIVANGPGLVMMRADESPVKKRIGILSTELDGLSFSACATTLEKLKKKEKKGNIPLIPEAKLVAGGVLRVMELQEAGYRYIRP